MKRTRGFTLLELLVVVIIVGILASVALPQFTRMTQRARRSEAANMVGAILTAEYVRSQELGPFLAFADNAALNAAAVAGDILIEVPPDANTDWDYVGTLQAGPPTQVTVVATYDGAAVLNDNTYQGIVRSDGSRVMDAL